MIPIIKPNLGQEEIKGIQSVIESGWIAQGPKTLEFEKSFGQYIGTPFAAAVSNCTTGLHLALLACGVKPGDVVLTVSHSFIATANSIRYCGAEPLFVDIDIDTYNISVEALKEILEKQCAFKGKQLFYKKKHRVAALLLVHQMGMPADLKQILPLMKKYRLPIVEDAACAVGSQYSFDGGKNWEQIGAPHGDVACFSFHPRKILTTGEGGMLTTRKATTDKTFRLLRHQGMDVSDLKRHQSNKIIFEKYPVLGFNYRMTDIQSAIGLAQLKKLPDMIVKRRQVAEIYLRELRDIAWLKLPLELKECRSNWQSFPVRVMPKAPLKRNQLMQKLLDAGIATRAGIMNAHEEAPYRKKDFKLVNSELARNTVIILPLYHQMTEEEVLKIITVLKS